jgi:hypothetical protein
VIERERESARARERGREGGKLDQKADLVTSSSGMPCSRMSSWSFLTFRGSAATAVMAALYLHHTHTHTHTHTSGVPRRVCKHYIYPAYIIFIILSHVISCNICYYIISGFPPLAAPVHNYVRLYQRFGFLKDLQGVL